MGVECWRNNLRQQQHYLLRTQQGMKNARETGSTKHIVMYSESLQNSEKIAKT